MGRKISKFPHCVLLYTAFIVCMRKRDGIVEQCHLLKDRGDDITSVLRSTMEYVREKMKENLNSNKWHSVNVITDDVPTQLYVVTLHASLYVIHLPILIYKSRIIGKFLLGLLQIIVDLNQVFFLKRKNRSTKKCALFSEVTCAHRTRYNWN